MLPFFKKKAKQPDEDIERGHKKLYVATVRGRRELAWLENDRWRPQIATVVPDEAEAPMVKVHYGTYGSDGLRRDGPPGGAYSAVYERYRHRGLDVYTRDEARRLNQWDTRYPFPGFDPKEGSVTLDLYSED
ncbi:MAG TPA: hypothetical protein VKY74_17635 [Chloroflexia bacterium]|nr:hypothetical protein [Chloroflexia bacterium]